ncbi:hypothetical protein F5Y13DRAFT_153347 [Hypoxylon sp. FL1857]|nr:hypothetical protein F5Y13DRAFT_153347 [Hypoxylon sp. FL1857]
MESFKNFQTTITGVAYALEIVVTILRCTVALRLRSNGLPPPHPMWVRYRRVFLTAMAVESFVGVGITSTFAALAWGNGGTWPLYLSSSIILWSMVRDGISMAGTWSYDQPSFAPRPLFCVLIGTGLCFIVGIPLMGPFPTWSWSFYQNSTTLYQFYMIWEWLRHVQVVQQNQGLFITPALFRIITFCFSGFGIGYQSLEYYVTFVMVSFVFYDFMVSTSILFAFCFRRLRRNRPTDDSSQVGLRNFPRDQEGGSGMDGSQ